MTPPETLTTKAQPRLTAEMKKTAGGLRTAPWRLRPRGFPACADRKGDVKSVPQPVIADRKPLIDLPPSISIRKQKSRRGGTPLEVFDHVGLLVNGPPGTAGLPFI